VSTLTARNARLIDAATGATVAGAQLSARIGEVATELDLLPPGPVFTLTGPTLAAALRYLGALDADRAVLPLDPGATSAELSQLTARFVPAVLTGLDPGRLAEFSGLAGAFCGYDVVKLPLLGPSLVRADAAGQPPHPDLAVLLATSGSTGGPKLVRLSRRGITANAAAITAAVGICGDDVAVTVLPLFYTYGLTVLNSHLAAGATVVLAEGDITSRAFWDAVATYEVTSLSLVPNQYEMLRRLRRGPDRYGRVRTMTVSGGRLRDETALYFHAGLRSRGGNLYVMYGQTEAGSRISVLPPDQLPYKLGCAGPGIPGVELSILRDDGSETTEPGVRGEVVCRSPSVMMGYANRAGDLAEPDGCHGRLHTGDLGHLDADGYLWLHGRINRIGKVFGIRVDLAAVEQMLASHGPVAVVAADDRIRIWVEGPEGRAQELARHVADRLRVHRSGVEVRFTDRLPTLPSGKTDYRSLEERS
jgi:acyl-coenzyme A synthetase/AMP-(fatty) acid ligase